MGLNDGQAEQQKPWRLRDIKWGVVFGRQDYANIFCSCLVVIALACVNFLAYPRQPDFFLYDATISYPFIGSPTIPSWVPVLVPFIMLIATIVVGELVHSREQHHSLTDAVATMLHFVLDGVQAFVFSIFMTVLTKTVCGRLRPDFLARCQPAVSANWQPDNQLAWGQDVTYNYPCTSTDSSTLEDGYKSFPSGHASTGFVLTVYASTYLLWCFNFRKPWNPEMRNWSFVRKFMSDFRNILAKYWMLAMLMFSWGVALSRVIDYQHNYSDILGGAFLGTLVALVYALRAIPRYKRVLSPESLEDAQTAAALKRLSTGGGFGASPPAGVGLGDGNSTSAEAELGLLGGGHAALRPSASGGRLREVTVAPSQL